MRATAGRRGCMTETAARHERAAFCIDSALAEADGADPTGLRYSEDVSGRSFSVRCDRPEPAATEAQLFRYYGSKSNLFGETIFKPLDERFLRFIDAHKPITLSDAEMREQKAVYTSELQKFIRTNSKMFTSLVAAEIYDAGTEHGAEQMRGRLKDKSAIAPELMVRLVFLSVLSAVMFRDWIFPKSLANPARIRPGPSAGERCRTASARADMHRELDHYLQA